MSSRTEPGADPIWPTPRVAAGGYTRDRGRPGSERPTLAGLAEIWPTPSAGQDTKGAQASRAAALERGSRGKQLALADRALIFSPPDPGISTHGALSFPTRRSLHRLLAGRGLFALPGRARHSYAPPTRKPARNPAREIWRRMARRAAWEARRKLYWNTPRLNPLFAEWLMGWPPGHALLSCSATGFARWRRDMRSALSALPLACGPWIWDPIEVSEPEQLALF
uniref:DNA methyltransferase n=1 Tax=Ruegeria arenilitoris TaxID=1173585 RepID=UPI0020C3DD17|nr:DNA methyltransferase [Ruegeria arenilitoris]